MSLPMKRYIPFMTAEPVISVLRLSGMIAAGGRGINDAMLAPSIERAFVKGNPVAVALAINSPGGSPVQSSLIAARIRRLSEEKEIPVVAFVEDVAASGGYWLACAADEIYADESSILGSIGVISAGFGFQELIGRYGIERRVHTAGNSKSFLDPFKPEQAEDVARLRALQDQIHDSFKAHVSARRGNKLPDDRDLFTGDVWVGSGAVDVGLADGIGHLKPMMQARYGEKAVFKVHGPRRSFMQRLGAGALSKVSAEIEERALYARFGL